MLRFFIKDRFLSNEKKLPELSTHQFFDSQNL